MIFDKISHCGYYTGLSARFQKAFDYLQKTDLAALPVGRYAIDGDDVYVMIQQATLKPWEEGKWEAHQAFADIQVVIAGKELMGVCGLDEALISQAYNPEKDVLFLQPDAPGVALPFESGDFAVLFPGDAHRPSIRQPGQPIDSRRAVVKVRL